MPPHHLTRRSRRLSRRAPVEDPSCPFHPCAPILEHLPLLDTVADYDCSLQLLHSGSDVDIKHPVRPLPPSPSACTTSSADSPPSIVTHLPFTPGSSHTRNRKQGHIPRPPNAFMVFRSWLWNKDNLKSIERDNRNVSRIAGRYWNELSEADRAPFRYMAEEAKARHAQLYPEYRYSPGSQKKPKVCQRRSQRGAEIENEKCNKVVDLLLGGIASRDLARHLGEVHKKVQPAALAVEGSSAESPTAAPRSKLKRPAAPPPQRRSKKQKTRLPCTPPSQYPLSLPIPPPTDTQVPHLFAPTPELVYPLDDMEQFVPTNDIPSLSLDSRNDPFVNKCHDDDLTTLFPSHLKPGADSVFAGVKPEATSFVDSCLLGAYTADALALATSVPLTDHDIASYLSLDAELVPLGSPVFTNPFESSTPSAEYTALLGTLDQLFGQPISPLSQMFPTENW